MNSKKANIASAIIAITALIIINISVFALVDTFTTNIWINYIFMMIAVVLNIVLTLCQIPRQPYFYGFGGAIISSVYMVVAIIAGVVFSFAFNFTPVISIVLHVVILAGALIAYIYAINVNQEVKKNQSIRENEVLNFKTALFGMEAVLNEIGYSESYKKTVQHAYDRMASAQTKSNPQVAELEKAILAKINELGFAVREKKESDISILCKDIEQLINERETKLRIIQ